MALKLPKGLTTVYPKVLFIHPVDIYCAPKYTMLSNPKGFVIYWRIEMGVEKIRVIQINKEK